MEEAQALCLEVNEPIDRCQHKQFAGSERRTIGHAKGKRDDVRAFGQMMVKDHGQSEQRLLQLAKAKGISLPAAAIGGIQSDINLKNASGSFDQLYVRAMVSGHQNKVQTFQNYATTGKAPGVRAFAQEMLPVLKQHLVEIKAIEEKLK